MSRPVRIATVSFLVEEKKVTVNKNIEKAMDYIDKAGKEKADIILLPEEFNFAFNPGYEKMEDVVETIPGNLSKIMSDRARKWKMNIIANYLVREGVKSYNQATIFDRFGKIIGFYRKVQTTPLEAKKITYGNELPVFDLDFGKIAVMICMDINFPEIVRIYALKGAEIVFWPTQAWGPEQFALDTQFTARAIDNSMIMVQSNFVGYPPYAEYANRFHPGRSRILDFDGRILADTGRRHGVAIATVDLDEVRLTSNSVGIRNPDHIKDDLHSMVRLDLYTREYSKLSKKQKRYY